MGKIFKTHLKGIKVDLNEWKEIPVLGQDDSGS